MTVYSSLLIEYLGEGVAASRPVSLDIPPGSLGLYYATDTKILSLWNGATPGWDNTLSPNVAATDGTTTVSNVTSFTFQGGATVSSGGAGVADILGPVSHARISLSSAQLLALHTAPVTIVPTPGSGKAILFIAGSLNFTAGAGIYSSTGNDEALYFGATTNEFSFAVTGQFTAVINNYAPLIVFTPPTNPTLVDNQPIVLYGPTANMTAGNGTAVLDLIYAIVNL